MRKILSSTLLLSLMVSNVMANEMPATSNVSIGASIGDFGFGGNVKYKINDQFGIRAGFDMFTLDNDTINDLLADEDSLKDIDIDDAKLKIQDFNFLVDWHPWSGNFRTSFGLIVNNSDLTGTLTPKSVTYTFSGYTFDTKDVGSIDITTDFDPVAPYLGIGGDTSFDKDSGWGFTYDLGVIFQGAAKVSYKPHYSANVTEDVKKEMNEAIEKEKISIQDDLDDVKVLPYYSIGFNYKF